jgi:tetratricopeptide (TPR) repeat protein
VRASRVGIGKADIVSHEASRHSVLPVKNKADAIDWERMIARFRPLETLPEAIRTTDSEAERILTVYNRALRQTQSGHRDIAKIALERLTSDWPDFTEAFMLNGALLAAERRYESAEEMFERALLASPAPRFIEVLEDGRRAARDDRIRQEASESSRRHREQMLRPISAQLAKSGVLQRAADAEGTGRVQMASKREQEDVMRGSGRWSEGRSDGGLSKTLRGLTVAVIAALVIFLIFFFALRPMILKSEARRERLEWLERVIEERAQDDASYQGLMDQYRKAFPGLDED